MHFHRTEKNKNEKKTNKNEDKWSTATSVVEQTDRNTRNRLKHDPHAAGDDDVDTSSNDDHFEYVFFLSK